MRVLFITKPYIIEPLGIAYLSSALKLDGHETNIFVAGLPGEGGRNWRHLIADDLFTFLRNARPSFDVLAYSVTTGEQDFYVSLNRKLRRHCMDRRPRGRENILSIFGGPHCTYFPESMDREYVDIIFRGESENSLRRVLKDPTKYIGQTIEFEPVDVNAIPLPDRELIYKFEKNRDNPIKDIMTSRGCPYSCPYCYNSVHKVDLRYRDLQSVIDEAVQVFNWYPKTELIFFQDDEFISNGKRLELFAKMWKEEVGMPYHAQIRIDRMDEDKIRILKDSGCISVTFAIECGSERTRKRLLRRNVSNEQILEGAKLLRKHGVKFRSQNMLGLPYETLDNSLETLYLNAKCKPTLGWTSLYQPYPKTPLGEFCKDHELYSGDFSDMPESFFEDTVLECFDEKRKKELRNLQRLFGFLVSYPILKPIVKVLIKCHNNKLYNWVHIKWKNRLFRKLFSLKDFYINKNR